MFSDRNPEKPGIYLKDMPFPRPPKKTGPKPDKAAAGRKPTPRWKLYAGIAAVLIVGALVWNTLTHPPAEAPTEPDTSSPSSSTTASTTVPETAPTPIETGTPATGRADDVAASFAADYAHTEGGKDPWLDRMTRWTTPQLADGYRLTDPNRLPVAHLRRMSPPLNSDSGTILYDAFYDTITLEIRLAYIEDRWLVVAALDATTVPEQVTETSAPETTPLIPPDLNTPATEGNPS